MYEQSGWFYYRDLPNGEWQFAYCAKGLLVPIAPPYEGFVA